LKEELEIPTPFGTVRLPKPERIFLPPPQIDERRAKALRHVVASDLAAIFGIIPIVGDIIADVVEDLHGAELSRILTPEEQEEYRKQDKVAPSIIALLRTFSKIKLK